MTQDDSHSSTTAEALAALLSGSTRSKTLPWTNTVNGLCAELARTAVARDKRGGHAAEERTLIRESGLLALSVAEELGGLGASWRHTLDVVRQIARVDSALAHVFAFHHLLLASVRFFGNEQQWRPWLQDTVQNRLFWGNALNPLDKGTVALPVAQSNSADQANKASGDGNPSPTSYLFDGRKGFCSGATDADRLLVSAFDETGRLLIAVVPGSRKGIQVLNDWDNMGQRQTDSGNVVFDKLAIHQNELLIDPGPLSSPFACLRPVLAQLILANIYLGIGEGALAQAGEFTGALTRPWLTAKVDTPQADPYVLRNFGELWLALEGARALTDRAADWFDTAWRRDLSLSEAERAAAALSTAAAKVSSARAALDVCNRMFEVMGARSTAARFALDRYWRNLRVHTLHDPIDYKLQELGDWALNGQWPKPTFYS